jgi:hypothetical protein
MTSTCAICGHDIEEIDPERIASLYADWQHVNIDLDDDHTPEREN